MNIGKLNSWFTLLTNLGVLSGIIFLVFELQQTQVGMLAQSSTARSEQAIENSIVSRSNEIRILQMKISSGLELSEEELDRGSIYLTRMLRFFENLHYQYQLGVLDEEIWAANLRGIGSVCGGELFQHVYTDWANGNSRIYRSSFVELCLAQM